MSRSPIYGPAGPEHQRLRYRLRREAYLAQGICPRCCVMELAPKRTSCAECLAKKSAAEALRLERVTGGVK